MTSAATATPLAASAEPRTPARLVPWLALAMTLLLAAAWAARDWSNLLALRLPDNDDMARLAQIRDWLNGQGFNDLMQYRVGPPGGSSMHWSRIPDLVPAALIVLLRPLMGQTGAEIVMVIAWPAMLFYAYLLLAVRIARRLAGERVAIPALLLAAIAFPTISLFIPGRIDHHALQIVLCFLLVDALIAAPGRRSGAVVGFATAISLAIGLESAPEILAAVAAMGLAWLAGGRDEDRRALGFAVALGGVTLFLLAFMRPTVWPEQWCDGFTPASSRGTLVLAGAWLLLGLAGTRTAGWKPRLAVAAVLGAAAAALTYKTSPVCLSGPYGALDPFLQHVWMRNVGEARDLFFGQDTIGTTVAYGGLALAGGLLVLPRLRDPKWRTFAIFLALSTVAAVLAIRVTYIVAGFAAIPFAVALVHAQGLGRRLAIWTIGAGIVWNYLGLEIDTVHVTKAIAEKRDRPLCILAAPLKAVAAQPTGTIIAPLDFGAYLTGMSNHHIVASVYHRNNSGNLAMYRFFLSPAARSEKLAHQWGIDYVAICPENLREDGMAPYRKGSLAEQLEGDGPAPAWLERIPTGGSIRLYRVH
ncbi:hypothetical protein [Sphingomonas sp.]|uniref:hypothetical protein n=1 Tax=Sphingomonas sp. TaxID=28214 RepID=UPI001B2A195B|nr:hypothetical protein [Sphingomonas sp.]MBO9714361.1 hypothetical protein [Sphingomonas sp.]